MKTKMTRKEQVYKVLSKNTKGPGITARQIAKKTGMVYGSVTKRISELRALGEPIFTNVSRNKTYYRLAS